MARVLPGSIYKHFKGGTYRIVGIAKHSDDLKDTVIYEALYENKLSKLWARPLEDFLSKKEVDGKLIDKFVLVEE